MASTSAVPSSTLTLRNPAPPPDKPSPTPAERFILFGQDWLRLQTFIGTALQLPISVGEFEAKYGSFTDEAMVKGCVDSMRNLQELSGTFGNPITIKQKIVHDGGYLTGATPPPELYGHIVWLALQIENAASTFGYTFASLKDIIGPGAGSKEERANNLKLILVGQGGLVSLAEDMKNKTDTLSSLLAKFDGDVSSASEGMLTYTAQSSQIRKKAEDLVGQYTKSIQDMQVAAADAYKKWRDYTIAAVTTSVGLMILTAGLAWPIALGLGVGLGVAAAKMKEEYNRLMGDIAKDQQKLQLKTRLVSDLTGLNGTLPDITGTLSAFRTKLGEIQGVWVNIGGNLQYIVSNYGVDQLSDLFWVQQAMKIGDAQHKWQGISTTASQFTQNSLVDMSLETQFGQQIAA